MWIQSQASVYMQIQNQGFLILTTLVMVSPTKWRQKENLKQMDFTDILGDVGWMIREPKYWDTGDALSVVWWTGPSTFVDEIRARHWGV